MIKQNKFYLNTLLSLILVMVLYIPGQYKFGVLRYVDEVATIVFICITMLTIKKYSFKEFQHIKLLSLAFISYAIFCSIMARLGQPILWMSVDAISFLKYPATYMYYRYCLNDSIKNQLVFHLGKICRIIVLICFILCLINLVNDIGMTYEIRYGLRSFKFIYNNPGSLVALMVFCFAVLSAGTSKKFYTYSFMCLFVMTLTLRGVAIVMVAVVLFCKFFMKRRIKWYHVVGIVLVGAIFGYTTLNYYFGSGGSHRMMLVQGGINVAKEYFPFGAGLASYGSDAAYKSYSPLYYSLGFDKIWGFSQSNGHIINDNFWPSVLGQFGIGGIVIYLMILFEMIKSIFYNKYKQMIFIGVIISFLCPLIGSLGAAVYGSDLGMGYAIALALVQSMEE